MVAFFEYLAESWPGWVCAILSGLVVRFRSQIKAQRCGIRALLRADIIRMYNKYMELGYCPIYVKQALEDEYIEYIALHGNGVIKQLHKELLELPTEKGE